MSAMFSLTMLRADVKLRRTTDLTDAPVEYGVIPREDWVQPDWIDEEKASASRQKMQEEGVLYGDSVS